MKNFLKYILIILVILLVPSRKFSQDNNIAFSFNKLFPLSENDLHWVDSTLANLSLREKCAQMIFPYTNGKDPSDFHKGYKRIIEIVKNEQPGGLLFLQGTFENQTRLINELQAISKVPLLITIDMERGVGMRLEDAVEFPFKMAFAATGDPTYDYWMAKAAAEEGRAIGVHQNFAPLVDVVDDYRNPIINVRAYSSDPKVVAIHSDSFIRGMHEGGMITTAKHFPGHGATDLDSHNELPIIDLTKEQLWNRDLKPFREAIKSGVKSVMIGHLDVPELSKTPGIPATFSYSIVTRLLKKEMGFDGLVVTDALNMHSLTDNFTQKEIALLAVQAGNDVLLFPESEKEMIDGLVEAVDQGRLTEKRIDKSVSKILKIKKWLNLDQEKFVDIEKAKKEINKKSHFRLAQDIAEKSITLVKDEQALIPLNPYEYSNVFLITISDSKSDKVIEEPLLFEKSIKEKFSYTKSYRVNFNSKQKDYRGIVDNAKKADLIILSIYANVKSFTGNIDLHEEQFEFINQLLQLDKPTIATSFGNPFVLSEVPDIPTYLTTYGNVPLSQSSTVNIILGDTPITGKLPVDLPKTFFRRGDGILYYPNKLFYQKLDTNYNFSIVDSLMRAGVNDHIFPGAALLVGHRGRVVFNSNYGRNTYDPNSKKIDEKSIFDLASLTKVIATTSAAMLLYDQGKLDLKEKVSTYLPQFGNNGKEKVTIENLLLHNSGLPPWRPFYKTYSDSADVINAIMKIKLDYKPGTDYQYSDLGMIVLQKVIESITKTGLDNFLEQNLFSKLGMKNTFFNPSPKVWYHCVPTEKDDYWRNRLLKGKVHDETAYLLNGISGHAGLFSTSEDLAKLMYVYLNNGRYLDQQIFDPATIQLFTTRNSGLNSRALGWDTKTDEKSSAGKFFSTDFSFGHTGFTGTSIWVDKKEGLFVILLTNRVYPTRTNRKIIEFRPKLHNAVYEAVTN